LSLIQDLKYAIRTLSKRPGFTLVAVITLALGIGATTAMFSVIDGVLLKPLRYRDADRIVAVGAYFPERNKTNPALPGADMVDVRDNAGVFDAFAFYIGGEMGVQVAGRAEFVPTYLVPPDFVRVFGVTPLAGRVFNADDEARSALVGAAFAVRNFGSVENALNKTLSFENKSYVIAGVLPADFHFPEKSEVWVARSPRPEIMNRSGYNYRSIAKLSPGVSLESANARLAAIGAQLQQQFPESNKGKTFVVTPLRDRLVAPVKMTLLFLMGAVGLVLLIACSNVANLLLARATARTQEMAVRAALGAKRTRIVRQLLVESSVLAVAAAGLGILIAEFATRLLLAGNAQWVPLPRLHDVNVDWRVLLFTFGVSLAASMAFGLAPALSSARVNLYDALKQKGSGAMSAHSTTLRNVLVVSQIALSFVLVVGAALLFRSFLALTSNDLGFQPEGQLVMYAHDPAATLDEYVRVGQFQADLFERLKQIPGVVSVAGAMGLPAGQYGSNGYYAVQGKTTFNGDFRKLPQAGFELAGPSYFSTMAIPLLRGREFTDADRYGSEQVAIISAALARQSFGNENPLGQRIICGMDEQTGKGMTVVGVVGDVRSDSPAAEKGADLYMPLRQHPYRANEFQVVMRTAVDPRSLIAPVQEVVRQMNPSVATKFTTLHEMVSDSVAAPRFRMALASTFAALALLLAIFGVYSVMSYVTAQRTPEFALRVALGARPAEIARLVLGRTAKLATIGVAVGAVLALAASRVLTSMLFGLKSTDTLTYAVVLAAVVPLVVLAAAVPALRAARVDPMHALRYE
jgi:putative ABC transport system permease protein